MTVEDASVDARWYRTTYPDVDILGMEAEEHYRLIGRHLGRRPRPEPVAGEGPLTDLAAAIAALPRRQVGAGEKDEASGQIFEPFPIIERPVDPAEGQEASLPPTGERPQARPLVVRAGETDVAVVADEASLARLLPVLGAFCRLNGLDPAAVIRAGTGDGSTPDRPIDLGGAPGDATVLAGPILRNGAHRLTDLWFASSHDVVLSFGTPDVRGEGAMVHLFQVDGRLNDAVALVGGQALAPQGPTFVEAALRNLLTPLLVVLADASGVTLELGLIPFPSLARGGLHAAELAALAEGDTSMDTLWRYGDARLGEVMAPVRSGVVAAIEVPLGDATGAEPIFSGEVAAWLRLFGITVEPADGAEPGDRSRLATVLAPPIMCLRDAVPTPDGRQVGPALLIPHDALPTIVALTRPLGGPAGGGGGASSYLVAEQGSNRPLWSVTLPKGSSDLQALQPQPSQLPVLRSGEGGEAREVRLPLAIVYRDVRPMGNVELLVPSPFDRPALPLPALARGGRGIVCALAVTEVDAARSFLGTLATQACADEVHVVTTASPADAEALAPLFNRLFPGRNRWAEGAGALDVRHLIDAADERPLLLAEDRTLLHDPRTLDTLRVLLATARTASAACVTLHETTTGPGRGIRSESGGYFPLRLSFVGSPHLVFDLPDTLGALPRQTYPVVANAFSATLVDPEALAATAARMEGWVAPGALVLDPLAFGLAALDAGWHHFCTSVVRAATSRPKRRADRTDPALGHVIAPARWESLLSEVTLVRELR